MNTPEVDTVVRVKNSCRDVAIGASLLTAMAFMLALLGPGWDAFLYVGAFFAGSGGISGGLWLALRSLLRGAG